MRGVPVPDIRSVLKGGCRCVKELAGSPADYYKVTKWGWGDASFEGAVWETFLAAKAKLKGMPMWKCGNVEM